MRSRSRPSAAAPERRSGTSATGTARRLAARVMSIALRCAIVTSHASTFASPGRSGYALSAARNVSDHASSASASPSTARHTRSTVGPWSATTASNGGLPVTGTPTLSQSEQLPRFRRGRLLQAQQEPLARQPARVSGEAAILADDPVAGHDHRQRVAPHRRAHVLGQRPFAKLLGQVAVRPRLPVRDAADQLPYLVLKRVSVRAEGQVEPLPVPGEVLGKLAFCRAEPGVVPVYERGGAGPVPVVREVHAGQPAVFGDEGQLTDRRIGDRVGDGHRGLPGSGVSDHVDASGPGNVRSAAAFCGKIRPVRGPHTLQNAPPGPMCPPAMPAWVRHSPAVHDPEGFSRGAMENPSGSWEYLPNG